MSGAATGSGLTEQQSFREWATTPHAQLGFSERQIEAQAVLSSLDRLRADQERLKKAGDAMAHDLARGHRGFASLAAWRGVRAGL